MIIPFDGVLRNIDNVEIGAGFSIVRIPENIIKQLITKYCKMVAIPENRLNNLKAGL